MTNSKQLACQATINRRNHTEKTETTRKIDPLTNLIGSLDRLSAEINSLLNEQPPGNEVLPDISQEAANVYAKLTTLYEEIKNTRICDEIKKGDKK